MSGFCSKSSYMMIAPTIQQTRCKVWIQKHLPADGSVTLSDVTSMYTAICIMGPFTRNLLSELTDTDLSPRSFPFFTFKELDVGLANGIRAMNLTHTGELGYVLYIPNEIVVARACDEMEENRISNKTLTEQGEEYKTYWKTKDEMDGPNAERHGGKKEDWRNTAKVEDWED
uniref:GCVT N-terminal domain-containing protein n=1 Tax=Timema monikensis TaxID=170555 RepID=A0A7R9DX09_9NEOP|nr:unnamed protein product [Timema monikensis]